MNIEVQAAKTILPMVENMASTGGQCMDISQNARTNLCVTSKNTLPHLWTLVPQSEAIKSYLLSVHYVLGTLLRVYSHHLIASSWKPQVLILCFTHFPKVLQYKGMGLN